MLNPTELYTKSVAAIQQDKDSVEVKNIIVEETSDDSLLVTGLIEDLTIDDDAKKERFTDKYRDVEAELTDSNIVNRVKEQFNIFKSDISLSDAVSESDVCIRLREAEYRISMQVKITDTISSGNLSELRSVICKDATGVPDESSLDTMVVNMADTNKEESTISYHDFTIHFTTDEPHTYWLNCETLEEYFEMVADNNEEMTVEDMRAKDTYYAHTHLMGENSAAEWIEKYANTVLTDNIEYSTTTVLSYPSRVSINFPESSVKLSCTLYQQLDS